MRRQRPLYPRIWEIYVAATCLSLSVGGPTVPPCSVETGWVNSAHYQSLYLANSSQASDLLTWHEARQECSRRHPHAALASFPRDIHDQTISCKIAPRVPYWVGLTAAYPSPAQLYWLDGSLETRSTQFSLSHNLSASTNETCGQVVLTIHSVFHRPLDWTLADCSSRQPYICLVNSSWLTTTTPVNQLTLSSGLKHGGSSSLPLPPTGPVLKRLKCASTMAPLTCLISRAGAAYANHDGVSDKERTDIITLANLVLEHHLKMARKSAPEGLGLKALLNFLHAVNARLQMVDNASNHSGETMTVSDVLHWTEDFVDMITQSCLISSNSSLILTHIDLSLVRAHLHTLPGLALAVGRGMVTVQNYTLEEKLNSTLVTNHTADDQSWERNNITLSSNHNVSDSVPALVVAILMNVPHATVRMDAGQAVLKSPVLSLSAAAGHRKLSLEHTFSIPTHSPQNALGLACGFQTQDNKSTEIWSTLGCELLAGSRSARDYHSEKATSPHAETNNSYYTRKDNTTNMTNSTWCRCNHTTNFAVLMSVVNIQLHQADRLALSVVTYIGCSASIISMVIAITVFCCLRSLNSERVCVHRNLCIAILAAQLTFISGINAVEEPRVCAAVALLLHYLVTSSLVWMLVEGLHLYCQVVSVFGTGHARMTYYTAFGWGVPAVLVGVSAAVDWQGYGTKYSCWLSVERSTVWMFVGPAVAVILVNSVILVSVIKIVIAAASQDKSNRFAPARAGAKAGLFLCPLMGLTWISGLAAVSREQIVFQYVFCALNSFQGFFIFLFHCVLNTEVKQTLRRMKEKRSLQRGEFPHSASTSHGQNSSLESGSPPESAHASPRPASFFRRLNKVHQCTAPGTGTEGQCRNCE